MTYFGYIAIIRNQDIVWHGIESTTVLYNIRYGIIPGQHPVRVLFAHVTAITVSMDVEKNEK